MPEELKNEDKNSAQDIMVIKRYLTPDGRGKIKEDSANVKRYWLSRDRRKRVSKDGSSTRVGQCLGVDDSLGHHQSIPKLAI